MNGGSDTNHEAFDVPESIAELSESCRDFVKRAVGVEPDFSPETLPLVDHYLGIARGGIDARPAVAELVFRAAGAYFGEVVRRNLGGFWRQSGADVHCWQLCARSAFLALNPAGVVREVLARGGALRGPDAALRLDREDEALVQKRLEALPPVSDEEFHLLSTRYEVLSITIETLRDKLRADGIDDLELGADDYEDLDHES